METLTKVLLLDGITIYVDDTNINLIFDNNNNRWYFTHDNHRYDWYDSYNGYMQVK